MLKSIDVNSLKQKIGSINVIDIRSIEKYNFSHIDTSINIPSDILLNNPTKYLKKDEEYYIYCQHGKTSIRVCLNLYRQGYKVININGGYESWLLS